MVPRCFLLSFFVRHGMIYTKFNKKGGTYHGADQETSKSKVAPKE